MRRDASPGADGRSGRSAYDVCIITTIHGDFDNRIYQRQLSALVGAGLRVCMVAPWNFANRKRTDFDFVATRMPQRRRDRVLHGIRTYRAVRRINAKVYIFHDPDFLPFGWLLARSGRSVIYDCHENIPEDIRYGKDWIPKPLRPLISSAFRLVENRVVKRLKRVIVSVPHLERRFRALGVEAVLVRNFARFSVPADFQRARAVLYTGDLTRDYGVFNVVAIGREMTRRGIDAPLRVVDRFREDEDMRSFVKDAIANEKLNMEILQPVLAENMPQILARGCIGLSPIPDLPNKRLAYPTKIFEFFTFGLPVIASDIEGTREILEDGALGILLPPDDAVAWVDAIERLLREPEYADHYREQGLKAVAARYNWHVDETRMVSYLRGVVGKAS